jgi:hypothetical protein
MKSIIIFCVMLLPLFNSYSCSFAGSIIAKQSEINRYNKIIADADVIHIARPEIIERASGYKVNRNLFSITPVKGKKYTYIEKTSVGGINKSENNKHIITLISLDSLREIADPSKQIGVVSVNEKPVRYTIFMPLNDSSEVIKTAKKRFGNNKLFTTEFQPDSPILFIDAGTIKPNNSIRIDYEIKRIGEIIIN